MATHFSSSASILLIQSIYGSWNSNWLLAPVEAALNASRTVTLNDLPNATMPLKESAIDGPIQGALKDNEVMFPMYKLEQCSTYDYIGMDFPRGRPQCNSQDHDHDDDFDLVDGIIASSSTLHGSPYASNIRFRQCKVEATDQGDTVVITDGVIYDVTKMMFYINAQLSSAAVAAIFAYLAITLCGLYRFIELLRDYAHGCTCRICRREFRLVRPIEGGANGKIHLARFVGAKCNFDLEVILKSIPVGDVSSISVTQEECRKLLSLNHRYVMKYYDDFIHREWGWNPLGRATLYCVIVTEFCERGSLADLIEQEYDTFTEEYIVTLFKKIAKALKYIHEQSVIHRDIKSPNIMLKANNVVRLGDFGLSDTFATKRSRRQARRVNILEIAAKTKINANRRAKAPMESHADSSPSSVSLSTPSQNTDSDCKGPSTPKNDKFVTYSNVEDASSTNTSVGRGMHSDGETTYELSDWVSPFSSGELDDCADTAAEDHDVPNPVINATSCRREKTQSTLAFYEEGSSNQKPIGTHCYMAPESIKKCVYGRAGDIWALGCVLLEMCSGVFMWELTYNLGECPENVPILVSQLPPMISRSTRVLISRMLSVDPKLRPSAAQVLKSPAVKGITSNRATQDPR
ncbi:Pkinase domain containing protein,putative [Babesia bigemina]|uniref:non-specific serine/threonine protein kinase n=1 Tax=Babesia bigemina TaxID=5866 RepID=A0A061D7K3_BABBI|nr:Pkinase domain containing protein,putative [Babesia bigemina]CDR95967.1 Pkinase domain containing protein,putative [Babesia bigemina]|eukprot:XP_012768153.1 Pkinase domain containing protein,putative [Babesia bigemina]